MKTSPRPAVRRVALGLGLVLGLLLGGLSGGLLLVAPASATAPAGGCWVWYAGSPESDISSSAAPWADPAAAPSGGADYALTLTPSSPAPGETVTAKLTWNKGPKNGGPAAALGGTYRLKVNGTIMNATTDLGTVAGGASVPGGDVSVQFSAVEGPNTVVFDGVTFLASRFTIKIDCNGQTGGTAGGVNPRTTPITTNVSASVTATGASVSPSASPSASSSPSTSPSTSPSASTSPSPSSTSSATAGSDAGKPATGSVTFACTLSPLDSDFDYPAEVSVSGYRAKAGDPVTLTATMSDLPGIAPVPIDGAMNATLGVVAGGTKAVLTGADDVTAAAKAAVPIPDLSGKVDSDQDDMTIAITTFAFDFADLGVGADCAAPASSSLGSMRVGTTAPAGSDAAGGTDSGTTSGGELPHTGGDMIPVILLLGGALLLVGSGTYLNVAGAPYRRRH